MWIWVRVWVFRVVWEGSLPHLSGVFQRQRLADVLGSRVRVWVRLGVGVRVRIRVKVRFRVEV